MRDRTRANLRLRVELFANSISNLRVADITPDTIFGYLGGRNVTRASKDNDRRVLSRFFGWCMSPPRRWTRINPARKETRERKPTRSAAPAVLNPDDCRKLMLAAGRYKDGRLAPYTAVCLFAGLRPFEAARLSWAQVNLKDREIRIEAHQTKTGRSRTIEINSTLLAWLKAHQGKPFYPKNWRKDFDAVKKIAGFGPQRDTEGNPTGLKEWPEDVLRHTAISHYFRLTGSYGRAAEQFGNSEAIIKAHYQGRVSTADTKKFYAIMPSKTRRQSSSPKKS